MERENIQCTSDRHFEFQYLSDIILPVSHFLAGSDNNNENPTENDDFVDDDTVEFNYEEFIENYMDEQNENHEITDNYVNEHEEIHDIVNHPAEDENHEIPIIHVDLARTVERTKCPICLDQWTKANTIPLVTPCGHVFCQPCLLQHFAQSNRHICPICSQPARANTCTQLYI